MSDLEADAFAGGPTEYEGVCFRDCDLTGAELGDLRFVDCDFERCNLSTAMWDGASLNQVAFRECKLLGAQLRRLRSTFLAIGFERCRLDYADLAGLKLARTRFVGCSLVEANFAGTDLVGATFIDCDLSGAVFLRTNLAGADLRAVEGLVLDPEQNTLARAKLSLASLPGLLTKHALEIE